LTWLTVSKPVIKTLLIGIGKTGERDFFMVRVKRRRMDCVRSKLEIMWKCRTGHPFFRVGIINEKIH
jgi:hypothetical protein